MSAPNPLEELCDLLAAERDLLLAGRFAELSELHDRKIGLAEALKLHSPTPKSLDAVLARASANQRLMEAASAGTRAAIRRLGELSRLESGQAVYGSNGSPVASVPAPRVLRRL
jgi:hypothetical protein